MCLLGNLKYVSDGNSEFFVIYSRLTDNGVRIGEKAAKTMLRVRRLAHNREEYEEEGEEEEKPTQVAGAPGGIAAQ